MIKLTFDGKDFKDDQGRVVVNPEAIKEIGSLYFKGVNFIWPHGYEFIATIKSDKGFNTFGPDMIKLLGKHKEKSLARTLYAGIPEEIKEEVRRGAKKMVEESTNKTTMEDKPQLKLSKKQIQVVEALMRPNAYLVGALDRPGERTGYVTTNGFPGWICSVSLATSKRLQEIGAIIQKSNMDYFRINPDFKLHPDGK